MAVESGQGAAGWEQEATAELEWGTAGWEQEAAAESGRGGAEWGAAGWEQEAAAEWVGVEQAG